MAKLTQAQIEACAVLWKDASENRRMADERNDEISENYFAGKAFSVAETFAAIMGLNWEAAYDMLRKRSKAL